MKIRNINRYLEILILAVMMAGLLFSSAGCTGTISGTAATELAATMVPPVDLDVYIYANQTVPTRVPSSLTGAPIDISVQSLAIWGIVNNDTQYTVAGALTFTSASDASAVFTQIPKAKDFYDKLTDRTIYVLKGSGGPAESIKNAIDNNNFKKYDDQKALSELSKMPSGNNTIAGVIGVVKPNKAAITMVKQYLNQNTGNTLDSVFSNAKTSILTLGVFSSKPIDLADISQRISNNTVWDLDIGIVVTMNSAYPGFIFSPIAGKVLGDQGFPKVTIGDITAYKDTVNLGNGKTIPLYLDVSGNHIFIASSGNDTYAQTLLKAINQ